MNVEIKQIVYEDKPILQNLMELYQYDFSEFDNSDVNRYGLFGYKYLDNYWTENGRFAFFIITNDKLAGFVLVRQHIGKNEIAEFFIMRKFRKRGLGNIVARKVFEMFKGDWQVSRELTNIPAQFFWEKVVGQYTKGVYKREEDANSITLIFNNDSK
jgi:predicted acetyltransferase